MSLARFTGGELDPPLGPGEYVECARCSATYGSVGTVVVGKRVKLIFKGVTPEQFERDFFATARPSSLLQRFADPAEVAPLVAFLASPLSAATNGAALRAEGGVVRSIL